ncbi:Bifunctional protein FolD [Labeo rohita]|uniref:Bifunctional protein FolD n=1 Tax=Labeo rohita TaxID=84645 RepID=A0ABQ8LPN3_LABRO|nr:Bifunctional protein FolD [Labeo rohita]
MSVSLKELCQMVNVPYDQARALIESESSDGESVEREEATMEDTVMEDTVMEDTVVHAGRGPSLLAPEQVQFDTVFNRGREEDSNAEEGAPPRKRLRAEKTWKKVINKKRRMVGKSYVGKQKQKEIMREPRAIGPRCSSAACAKSAKHHCSAIGTPERNNIFNEFWQHMTWEEKRMYVHGIGEWSALNWAKEGPTQADTEGQTHSNARRSVAGHEFIHSFLQDLPKVPSHYCRSTTSKQYLEPVFQSMADLYAVYCRAAAEKNATPLSRQTGNLPDDEWQHHLLQKEEARAEKLSDKNKASNNTMVLCMDLQALLLCPKLKASALYYKTKLAVHNFTVYNMLTHSATCYVWHEGEGSLSASEFASCIVNYLSAHTEPDTFILWSDGCGYQNRNAVLSNALLQFSMKKNKVVIQKYLEKGHTQMECDSVHSVIERRLRDQDVYLPAEYVNLMKKARVKPHPYEVKYIDHTFFQDFTKLRLCKSLRPGVRPGDPTVHDIRAIRYNNNGTMDFKINHSDDWHPHPSHQLRNSTSDSHTVTPLYSDRLKINELKFKHLQDLKEVIPKDFHSFYNNLLH